VNRDTGNVLLVLVGGAILRISVGDTFLRYVRGGLQIPLIIAGSVLILLGLASIWRENPGRRGRSAVATADTEELVGAQAGRTSGHLTGEAVDAIDPVDDGPAAGGQVARDEHGRNEHGYGEHGRDAHGHAHGNRVAWLLLLPVFAIFLIAPPALGAYAADRATATRSPCGWTSTRPGRSGTVGATWPAAASA
jgi:hypothetical protein